MKLTHAVLCICTLLLLVNCKKTDQQAFISGPVSISQTLIFLDSRQGSSDTFHIIAEGDWEISYPAAFKDFIFSPSKGRGNTLVTITVQKANLENDGITFPFSAQSGKNHASANVIQDAFMRDAESHILATPGSDEIAQSIPLSDGGFLHVGSSSGVSNDIKHNSGKADVLLIKTDNKGAVSWIKTFGGTEDDFGYSCIETDEGFFITGESSSNSIGFEGNKGMSDLLLLKTDKSGNLIWQKKFGGSDMESGRKIRLGADNNIMVVGNTKSRDGDVPATNFRSPIQGIWTIQFDHNGEIIEQYLNLTPMESGAFDFHFRSPSTVITSGYQMAQRGTVLHKNYLVSSVSLDIYSQNFWGATRDGYQDEVVFACIATPDGGTITVGHSDGVIAESGPTGAGSQAYIVKFNSKGIIEWQREWGRRGVEHIYGIQSVGPGRYILCGAISSFITYLGSGGRPNVDGYILEINEFGMVQWEANFGGNGNDFFTSVIPLGNEEYLLTGKTNSTKMQYSSKPDTGNDAWIVRFKR